MATHQRGSDDQPVSGVGVEVGKLVGMYSNLAFNRDFDYTLPQLFSTPYADIIREPDSPLVLEQRYFPERDGRNAYLSRLRLP